MRALLRRFFGLGAPTCCDTAPPGLSAGLSPRYSQLRAYLAINEGELLIGWNRQPGRHFAFS